MTRSLILTITSLSLSLSFFGAATVEAASSGLIVTFDNIPNRIRRDNPHLAAARLRVREALGRMKQAGRRSNPEFEGGLEQTGFREGKIEIGLSQRFPVTDRLRLEKSISVIELKAAEAEIKEVERQLIAQARSALVEVLAYREQRTLRKKQVAISTKLAEFIKQSADKGEATLIDAGQTKLDAVRHSSSIRQLQANEVAAIGTLKPLLGMNVGDSLNVTGSLPTATLPTGTVDPRKRPDFRVAQLDAEAARQSVALEKTRRYDDIEAGFVAGLERTEDAPEGLENAGIIGSRIKLALPFWDKNEGNIEAAQARAERKQKETNALAHNIRHEADSSRREMIEWNKMLHEINTTLLPLADHQADTAETGYREGFANLPAVLRAREQQLELADSRIEALRNFHLARVRFETAIANP